jgi:hypothetical protein
LWSWLVASATTSWPSLTTMKLASSPCRNCSMTTRAPATLCATPSTLSRRIMSMAACASSSVIATTTPLPAARPSALMTMGAPSASTWACAASASLNTS